MMASLATRGMTKNKEIPLRLLTLLRSIAHLNEELQEVAVSKPPAPASAIDAMSFEQAMKELEDIVRRMEGGNADLETAIGDYKRGMALQQHCMKKLSSAKLEIEAVVKGQDGSPGLQPFADSAS